MSAQWDQADSSWPTYQKLLQQAQAEMAAWEAWSAGEDQEVPQVLAAISTAENCSDPLHLGSEGGRSQGGGSRTGTRAQGRALPAPPCEGEVVSRDKSSSQTWAGSAESPGSQLLLQGPFKRSCGKQHLGVQSCLLRVSSPWQRFDSQHSWTPRPPAQPRSKEVRKRWRKAENPAPAEEMGAAAKLERLQPE